MPPCVLWRTELGLQGNSDLAGKYSHLMQKGLETGWDSGRWGYRVHLHILGKERGEGLSWHSDPQKR